VDTLGIVDSRSIAAGTLLADAMLKAASVTLVRAAVVCAGRLLILVEGDREAVATALHAARQSEPRLAGCYSISPVDPQVQAALRRGPKTAAGPALGVVECRNAADGLMAADAAVKKAAVALMRLVLGQGIGGKSFFVLTGEVAAVREAVDAAAAGLGKSLLRAVVLPRPEPEVTQALAGVAQT
jgi:microcompartment protein CcmL/EutN